MDWQIRLMSPDDLSAITNVECTALHISKNKARNISFLELALKNNSEGCFVAVLGGCVVGYIITLITGNAGWIGSIEVSLSQGGNGMKLALLNEAINYLNKKVAITAIQLPNESIRFVQKCVELGFQIVEPQIILFKETEKLNQLPEKKIVSVIETEDIFNVEEFMKLSAESNIAEIIKLDTEQTIAGNLLLEIQSRRFNHNSDYKLVTFGYVLRNLTAGPLKAILTLAGKKAYQSGSKKIYIALNGFYRNELKVLVESGWVIAKTTHRLIYSKSVPTYKKLLAKPVIDLSQWTM